VIAESNEDQGFTRSRGCFDEVVGWLDGAEAGELEHAELEDRLEVAGRDLLRRLLQDHLDLRAEREARLSEVVDVGGVRHGTVEDGHARRLGTVFGQVTVSRLAYRHRGHHNLYPADAALNLPTERHSHGLRRLAAAEASRGSFDEAAAALERATGQHLGKRQVEALADRAAVDVDAFYATRAHPHAAHGDVLVISADGKGIVMRPDALRPATARAAAAATNKLTCRLSKGEKRNRKRLAEVGAVYDLTPVARTPADVLATPVSGWLPRRRSSSCCTCSAKEPSRPTSRCPSPCCGPCGKPSATASPGRSCGPEPAGGWTGPEPAGH